MAHPYSGLPAHQFWPAAMTSPAPGHINPAQSTRITIEPHHKIVSMGSCFAQHLARDIRKSGFNYLITEAAPPGMAVSVAKERGYSSFSARYGNVYTVRQAVQLFDRAFGKFKPQEQVWMRDKRYVDPFRPTIEPHGFASVAELLDDQRLHLESVRLAFGQNDCFIFTLGLTEAWRSKLDGAVYPLAPGISGGAFDPAQHEFVNFNVTEVIEDIAGLRNRLFRVNPAARIILTVSPVALAATYESRHVLVSNVCSKAVLRVAADEAVRQFGNIEYFPSYEIITSPAAGGRYFDDDLRNVTRAGVDHVMRIFYSTYCAQKHATPADSYLDAVASLERDMKIPCDESLLPDGNGTSSADTARFRSEMPIPVSTAEAPLTQATFDEVRYLEKYPDVAQAVRDEEFSSGWHHYEHFGKQEGRTAD